MLKKILIPFSVLILLIVVGWAFYYRSTCEGCGGCSYEKFTDHIQMKNIIRKEDSIYEIYFISTIDTNALYQLYPDELHFIEKNFDLKEITDTSKKYTIYGDRISDGACAPYFITTMLRDKK